MSDDKERRLRDSLEHERWEIAKKCANALEREEWGTEAFETAAFALWYAMSGAQRESLNQILFQGPVWDGDHISKSARDDLFKLGLATRVCHKGEQGFTAASYRAYTVYSAAGQHKQSKLDKWREQRKAERLAAECARATIGGEIDQRAIAALEPIAPPSVEKPADDQPHDGEFGDERVDWPDGDGVEASAAAEASVELPEGFLRSYNGTCEVPSGTLVEYVREDGSRGCGEASLGWIGHPVKTKTLEVDVPIVGYRPISQPAESEEQPEQAEDAASGESEAAVNAAMDELVTKLVGDVTFSPDIAATQTYMDGDQLVVRELSAGEFYAPADEPTSITEDPEFVAAVERAEATLAAEPAAYVGLNDPDLDAEFDAMKAREAAEKAKPRFSIWGGKREKVDA